MDPLTIIGGILTATTAGLGFGVGSRLMPISLKARRDLRKWKRPVKRKATAASRKTKVEE